LNKKEYESMAVKAADMLSGVTDIKPRVGLIFGSGLGEMVSEFNDAVSVEFGRIPGFPVSSVKGHRGEVVIGSIEGVDVMALAGRTHYYEGYSMQEVSFPVSVMGQLGIKRLIVTNAGGAVNDSYTPGDIVIIRDHINLMGDNPLIGGPEFIDMTDAYSKRLSSMVEDAGKELGLNLKKGVYLAMSGPSYETPAEIRMVSIMGADIVGMSTVPEVIMANSLSIEVVGLSMITNMAAGITGEPLSHEEVIATSEKARGKFKELVRNIVVRIDKD